MVENVWSDLVIGSLFDVGKGCDEVTKDFSRDHDGVSVTSDVFGDFDDASSAILFQIEKEDFAISEDFFGM